MPTATVSRVHVTTSAAGPLPKGYKKRGLTFDKGVIYFFKKAAGPLPKGY
jgi:hypothetical protein